MKTNFLYKFSKEEIFSVGLILLMVFSRLIPHPPNFTPIIATGILCGYFFKDLKLSLIILLLSMLISDLLIGFYSNMLFVYSSLFLITLFAFKMNNKINIKNLFLFGFAGSFLFYLISNFGVWIFGSLYPKNIGGLIECYFMAIPFFKNTLISTTVFIYLVFILKKAINTFFLKNITQ